MENNFTIDPDFIDTLPDDDPLFVAEFNHKLAQLENPALMHQFGLILENVDGLDNPTQKFVMRGVPHTLGLINSRTRPTNLPGAPAEMTGWSGDGSPGGTLRDFATGAVTQHFTKTLKRIPGKDFRLPNPHELNAMEAFQLSLGRQDDPDLSTLMLQSPVAQAGQNIFVNGTGNLSAPGKCSACHRNSGALNTPNGENRNFNTGVENKPKPTPMAGIPRDGGFGTASVNPAGCPDAPSPNCGFGNGSFNTPPLVEAADTGPFFHNNIIDNIEDAVDFFNSSQFNTPATIAFGGNIQLDSTQVLQVAAFLRVINALENIRSAVLFDNSAMGASNFGRAKKSLSVALADLQDAIEVLDRDGVSLHPNATADLMEAAELTEQAINTPNSATRNDLINDAIDEALSAREDMCQLGSDITLCPN